MNKEEKLLTEINKLLDIKLENCKLLSDFIVNNDRINLQTAVVDNIQSLIKKYYEEIFINLKMPQDISECIVGILIDKRKLTMQFKNSNFFIDLSKTIKIDESSIYDFLIILVQEVYINNPSSLKTVLDKILFDSKLSIFNFDYTNYYIFSLSWSKEITVEMINCEYIHPAQTNRIFIMRIYNYLADYNPWQNKNNSNQFLINLNDSKNLNDLTSWFEIQLSNNKNTSACFIETNLLGNLFNCTLIVKGCDIDFNGTATNANEAKQITIAKFIKFCENNNFSVVHEYDKVATFQPIFLTLESIYSKKPLENQNKNSSMISNEINMETLVQLGLKPLLIKYYYLNNPDGNKICQLLLSNVEKVFLGCEKTDIDSLNDLYKGLKEFLRLNK